jgi:hypothetical protein
VRTERRRVTGFGEKIELAGRIFLSSWSLTKEIAMHKLIKHTSQGEHKSLFSLLLFIEEKIGKHARQEGRIKRGEAVKRAQQRRPVVSKLSRYVE